MKVTDQVENILRVSQKARNSDKELMIIYMQKFGMELSEKQIDLFRQMPAFETIRRIRQKLQEEGKYPASKEVDNARFEKYKQVRGEIGVGDPEQLLEAKGYRVIPFGEG